MHTVKRARSYNSTSDIVTVEESMSPVLPLFSSASQGRDPELWRRLRRRRILNASIVFSLLFMAVTGWIMLVNVSAVHDHVDYGVVIDAGSSGSRVHIYEWPHRSDTRMPLIEAAPFKETTKWSKKVEPGLSSYASNPSGAATSIAELLTYVASVIPPVDHARTPVYVYGTAGLRKVPPTEAEHILNAVRDTVHHSPFLFRREWARIISGQEEGTFGWITVNHLKGTLHARQSQDSHLTTVGALDLGGASTQITFAMPPENTAPHPHVLPITLGGVTYQLFSQSLLGFGVDELQRRSAALARAQAPSTKIGRASCRERV